MADKRDILIRLLGEETVSRMAGRAEKGLDRFGDSLEATEKDAKGLDRQIAETEHNLKTLAVAFARTSDAADRMDISKGIRKQQADLRKLVKARDWLPGDDDSRREGMRFGVRLGQSAAKGLASVGETTANVFGKSLGSLPPQAQAAIGAGLVAAVTAVTPLIGGAVSGAIVGGVGAGGIIGGIAIAAKHPAVQQAAKDTGAELSSALQSAAVSFVPATIESLSIVRSEIGDIKADLEDAFGALSPKLPGLTRDVLAGMSRAVEGFTHAAERSGPALDALGTIAQRTGDVVADTFESLSAHSVEAAHALLTLWGVFEVGIRATAATIEGLTVAYGWFEKFGAILTGDTATLGRLAAEQELAKQSGDGLSQGMQDLIAGFRGAGGEAAAAAVKIETLDEMVRRLTSENLNAEQANLRLEEAIDRASEAAKEGARKGIDPNTEAGRKNRQALLGIAQAAQASSAAILEQTGSQELASAATERGRAKFIATAQAMGVEKGEAVALANELFGLPKEVTTNANFNPDNAGVKAWKKTLSGIPREIFTKAEFRLINKGDVAMALRLGRLSTGGPVTGSGPKGVDSQPYLLAPGEYVLNADDVDAAGGVAGVERLRNMLHGRGGVAPATAGATRAGGTAPTEAPAAAGPSADLPALTAALTAAFRAAVAGMSVQLDGRTVGYIQGRQADIYAR